MIEIELNKLTYKEIFDKLESRTYVLVHIKDTMQPCLLEPESGKLFEVPDGYLEYDKKYFRRNI